ncbi:hypothetical protein DID88_009336 [Monilinia fructigena]|uniref:cellulose 1,4-beta-cellobiosidase (non-reducing end) n=1 Tax=Monilinia fructigena TaxID=38457 RepID=A0A395IMS2_9HELO|nr:hypothetical protein DID88_009336 [Monilinia fructigena]
MKFVEGTANNVGGSLIATLLTPEPVTSDPAASEFDVGKPTPCPRLSLLTSAQLMVQPLALVMTVPPTLVSVIADGCDFNPYRVQRCYQFITDDGTETGTLTEIKRFYVQGDVVFEQPNSDIAGVSGNSITDDFCSAQKTAFGDVDYFTKKGGMAAMGKKMADGVARGSCAATSGVAADVEAASGLPMLLSPASNTDQSVTFKAPSHLPDLVVAPTVIATSVAAPATTAESAAPLAPGRFL